MFPDRLTEFLEQYRYGVPFCGEAGSSPVPTGVTRARGGLQAVVDDPALGPLVGRLVPGS